MSKQILVGGGTGFVGKALVKKLLKLDHRVVVLTRNTDLLKDFYKSPNKFPQNFEYRHWDDLEETRQDLNIDVCINLSGERVIDSEWTPEFKKSKILFLT